MVGKLCFVNVVCSCFVFSHFFDAFNFNILRILSFPFIVLNKLINSFFCNFMTITKIKHFIMRYSHSYISNLPTTHLNFVITILRLLWFGIYCFVDLVWFSVFKFEVLHI